MTTAIFNTDGAILLWIQNSLRAPWLSPIVVGVTHLGDAGVFWILVTLALLCFRRTRKLGITCAISMLIGLAATNLIIKNWVARVRPYELVAGLERIIGAQRDWSFPSGHTTNSFACAWVLFRRAPRRYGVPALVMAALIALSRLYVGVHYPTDVFAAIAIGIAAAEAAIVIVKALRKKFPAFKEFTRTKPKKKAKKA